MNFYRFAPLACVLAMCVAACETTVPLYIKMPEDARRLVTSTDVVAAIPQQEIHIAFLPSRTTELMSGGLLWALVDTAVDANRNANAAEAAAPLRDATLDYRFDEVFTAELQKSLAEVPWLNASEIRVLKDTLPATLDQTITGSSDAAVMIVKTDYSLTNDARSLILQALVEIYPRSQDLLAYRQYKPNERMASAPGNTIYRTINVHLETGPTGEFDNRDAIIAAWAADDGKLLREKLNAAAEEVAFQIAADIQVLPSE